MIANKQIEKIVSVIVALAVVLCCVAMGVAEKLTDLAGGAGVSMDYSTKLFDTSAPITVNILMDEAEWQDMLQTASSEVYHKCNVEIAGKTFYEVGIRPKGNTSLSAIATNPDTDRYSFKLEFDQYIDDQTCFGLDKLVLNNNYADATNMKEALIYDMYRYMGANASQYNYAKVCVNGEYWGVYLALEAVEDSFLLRNFGVSVGELYKPDSMDMGDKGKDFDAGDRPQPGGGGDAADGDNGFGPSGGGSAGDNGFGPSSGGSAGGNGFGPSSGASAGDNGTGPSSGTPAEGGANAENGAPNTENTPPEGDFSPPSGFGGFSMGGNGANLNYTDDDLDSYSSIWDGAVTKTNKADRKRVVKALKNIAEGTDLESYMDIDNLLRYMAVHVFSVNDDSLTGTMAHNYYLYEKDGRLNMIPWDYNLSLGGMGGMGNASGVINDAIDGAFSGTKFFDTLMAREEYTEQYHANLRRLVEEYINGGGFEEFYTRTRAILDELVETDPTAFYTYEEYADAAETLYQVVKLRGQSILGQLDGTIPSTESGQRQDSASLVDTGDLDLSIMGTMNMGNGGMGGGGGFKGFGGGFNFGGGFVGGTGFDPSQFGTPPDGGKAPADKESGASDNAPESAQGDSTDSASPAAQSAPTDSTPAAAPSTSTDSVPALTQGVPTGNAPAAPQGTPANGNAAGMPSMPSGGMPEGFEPSQSGSAQDGFGPSQSGSMTDGAAPAQPAALPSGADASGFAPSSGAPAGMPDGAAPVLTAAAPAEPAVESTEEATEETSTPAARPDRENRDFPGFPGQSSKSDPSAVRTKNLILYGISFAVLVAALTAVSLYKRKSKKI